MRYFIKLAYDGSGFHGWQSQPNAISVQQRIEEALATVLRVPTPVTGAGRTDTGVNARVMYAHFDAEIHPALLTSKSTKSGQSQLVASLNRLVGPLIAIHDIYPVDSEAHARFDAVSRTYKYFVSHLKSPFFGRYSWFCSAPLDYEAMNRAAELLLSTSDFTSFAKLHSDAKTNICRVTEARWTPVADSNGDVWVFTITADRFLRNMVRAVVGTLIEVGRGKMSVDGFADVIACRNRCSAGTSMPPYALFLWNVHYHEPER